MAGLPEDIENDVVETIEFPAAREPPRGTQSLPVPEFPDPEAHGKLRQERTREWLALSLVGLLAFVVVAVIIGALVGGETATLALYAADVLMAPTVGLVAAVTGFYFATKR